MPAIRLLLKVGGFSRQGNDLSHTEVHFPHRQRINHPSDRPQSPCRLQSDTPLYPPPPYQSGFGQHP